jgi:hypothetical protein
MTFGLRLYYDSIQPNNKAIMKTLHYLHYFNRVKHYGTPNQSEKKSFRKNRHVDTTITASFVKSAIRATQSL